MSLDFRLMQMQRVDVCNMNITHNLGRMASAAGIYDALWHPERIKAKYAKDIIPLLEAGLKKMRAKPKVYAKHDAPNGWGTYMQFVPWVEKVLEVCKKYPEAEIEVSI